MPRSSTSRTYNSHMTKKSKLAPIIFLLVVVFVSLIFYISKKSQQVPTATPGDPMIISGTFDQSKFKTNDEWKKILTTEQYHILREQGTEIPFTGALDHESRKGTYYSVGCNEPVFRSEAKYDSGTGWPSFWQPINAGALVLRRDNSLIGGERIEVLDKCGGHLGHVFDDGPTTLPDGRQATGKRYCMNSAALHFVSDK